MEPSQDITTLLRIYPILESVIPHLGFGDLLNLSRISSLHRALLHGLPPPHNDLLPGSNVRRDLFIGNADTGLWKHLKKICHLTCAESSHTKGSTPQGCKLCSVPICSACIVKSSFGKNENTFGNRRRILCNDCWVSGNPHTERLQYVADIPVILNYNRMALCRCTAKDGFLCTKCKDKHNNRSDVGQARCHGKDCHNEVIQDDRGGRICLWCDLPLPGARVSEDQRWRDYEAKYPIHNFEDTPWSSGEDSTSPITSTFDDQRHPNSSPLASLLAEGSNPHLHQDQPPQLSPVEAPPAGGTGDAPPYETHATDLRITEPTHGGQ